jgi:hypothetical protein
MIFKFVLFFEFIQSPWLQEIYVMVLSCFFKIVIIISHQLA